MAKIKLFFVPHAGGSAMGYMVLKRFLDTSFIEIVPLELAGRGARIKEPCFTDASECAKDLYEKMKPQIADCDYAIFGHSLGTIVTFELIHFIMGIGGKLPKCAIFSGRVSPGAHFPVGDISTYEDDEFLKQFGRLQALPEELLNNEQIKKLMLPVLRADVFMAEKYRYKKRKPLDCDLYAFYGAADSLIYPEGMEAWKTESSQHVELIEFSGGHFYYKEDGEQFGKRINTILEKYSK